MQFLAFCCKKLTESGGKRGKHGLNLKKLHYLQLINTQYRSCKSLPGRLYYLLTAGK